MEPIKMACRYCNWWDGNEEAKWSVCKVSGPSVCLTDENDAVTVWPETQSDDWCRLFSDRHKEPVERDTDDTVRIFVGIDGKADSYDVPRQWTVHDAIVMVKSRKDIGPGNHALVRLVDGIELNGTGFMMDPDIEDCSRYDLIDKTKSTQVSGLQN